MEAQNRQYEIPAEILELEYKPQQYKLAWRGKLLPDWAGKAERVQIVTPVEGSNYQQSQLKQWESMSGAASYVFKYVMGIPEQLANSNLLYSNDVKKRAEELPGSISIYDNRQNHPYIALYDERYLLLVDSQAVRCGEGNVGYVHLENSLHTSSNMLGALAHSSLTLAPISSLARPTPTGPHDTLGLHSAECIGSNPEPINYLAKARAGQLQLIDGDTDVVADLLNYLKQYQDTFDRNESLASGLGAKLMGPRILQGIESVFGGPIITKPPQTVLCSNPVTWLDIVEHAKAKHDQVTEFRSADGARRCRFMLKGSQVEIPEDDWRLAASGALSRMSLAPPEAFQDDQATELATLDIIQERVDAVARMAEELVASTRGVKTEIARRRGAVAGRSLRQQQPNSDVQAPIQLSSTMKQTPGDDLRTDLLQQILSNNAKRLSSISPALSTPTIVGLPAIRLNLGQRNLKIDT
ncbi:hypothetical protein JX266_014109 [Neoarthrinium moseri]|nr:hypothetical protein JX266_014109 [Neoarthrinium moseri]